MPRDFAPKTKAIFVEFLKERDGPGCYLCRAEPTAEPLEIDHIDPDGPNLPANWRLLCKACNLARRRKPGDRGILREGESAGQALLALTDTKSPTGKAKNGIAYAEGSTEMRASGWFEPRYRHWVCSNAPMPKEEAINGGAEESGCAVQTAARYLGKLTSSRGPLRIINDEHGTPYVTWKPGQGG